MIKKAIVISFIIAASVQLFAQSANSEGHAFILRGDIVLYGSELPNRKGIGIGYGYFYEKWVIKSFIEASREDISTQERTEIDSKFRVKAEVDYRLMKHFSLGAYVAPTARYYSFFQQEGQVLEYRYLTDFVLGLGFRPAFYLDIEKYYLSVGVNLPFAEIGQFIVDENDITNPSRPIISSDLELRLFHKEVEGVLSVGFRF